MLLTARSRAVHSRPMAVRRTLRGVCIVLVGIATLAAIASGAAAKEAWIEVHSPHFTIISNAGDKEARKLADQFEQFREMFHNSFPKLRVDLGKPLIIFAVKNQASMKALIPAYWESKELAHPSGIYISGEERHYVIVRTDVESSNPYHVVYHEYTHAIMDRNFMGLPLWLNEGLAEFYGNSTIFNKYVEIGKVAPEHLSTLSEKKLIPIETLLQADERSPFYNEANHTSMFYAESWAIVHYLMLDPEARRQQLLTKFLSAWSATGDQFAAAQQTFGDLNKFGAEMESYARRRTFYVGRINTTIHDDPKSFTSRSLSDAEVNAQRALFYAHTKRPIEAQIAIEDALKSDPDLPLTYEAQGFLAYSQQKFRDAEKYFTRAIELHSTDYFPYYFAAEAQLRSGKPSEDQIPGVIASLEKAIEMNQEFAPAYAALASVYSIRPETHDKALAAGHNAIQLEPGNLFYATNYGYVLANAGRTGEAKTLALRIQEVAKTPVERDSVQQLLTAIANRENYDRRVAEMKRQPSEPIAPVAAVPTPKLSEPAEETAPNPVVAAHQGENEWAVEGNVVSADCGAGPGKVAISEGKTMFRFRVRDFASLDVATTAKQDKNVPPPCADWNNRRVRVYFYKLKDKGFTGELSTLQFL